MTEFNELNVGNHEGIFDFSYREEGVFLIVRSSGSIDKRTIMGQIIDKIIRKGIKNVDRQAIQEAVDASNGKQFKIANFQEEAVVDAALNIIISQEKMSAALILLEPEGGGKTLSMGDIIKQIQAKGIVFGIDNKLLEEFASKPRYNERIEFAKGQEIQRGEDGKVELLFDLEGHKKPTILEDGSVNFHEIHSIAMASKGQELARVLPQKQGTPGKTVLGQAIPAVNGKPAAIPRGKNTDLINKDSHFSIVAAIDGQISYIDNKINVLNIYEVPGNVGVETGNIHFVGNVIVKGNVLTDYVIEASGNVEVNGVVEGATIKAGGDIIVSRGIQGLNKAVLISQHDIVAKYIEHSTITASNDIKCEAVMHSNINCGNILELGGKKGLIVGGKIKVGREIKAKYIGSQMSTVTEIEVGIDPTIRDKHKVVKAQIAELETEIKKTEQAVDLLKRQQAAGQLIAARQEMLNKLIRTKIEISTKLSELHHELEEMEERLLEANEGKIKISDTIYPGVKVTIGSASKFIKENIQFATLHLDGAEIKALPYEK